MRAAPPRRRNLRRTDGTPGSRRAQPLGTVGARGASKCPARRRDGPPGAATRNAAGAGSPASVSRRARPQGASATVPKPPSNRLGMFLKLPEASTPWDAAGDAGGEKWTLRSESVEDVRPRIGRSRSPAIEEGVPGPEPALPCFSIIAESTPEWVLCLASLLRRMRSSDFSLLTGLLTPSSSEKYMVSEVSSASEPSFSWSLMRTSSRFRCLTGDWRRALTSLVAFRALRNAGARGASSPSLSVMTTFFASASVFWRKGVWRTCAALFLVLGARCRRAWRNGVARSTNSLLKNCSSPDGRINLISGLPSRITFFIAGAVASFGEYGKSPWIIRNAVAPNDHTSVSSS
mmetsp:Transcript_108298/g.303343  ORF Transcript_108298/g.303343 Transcript_108298/m.303343 type:complete len:347 (-) Transcript_108298:702-1742(-)